MSNPVIDAFFLGRALAEVVGEKFEDAYTNAMSELGKFDAEQREHLRVFIEEVQLRAQQSATSGYTTNSGDNRNSETSGDLQEMLDRLRAEIASLRSELKKYRH
jgi:hypothetical protein